MSNSELLESFRNAYKNLQLLPLITPEELVRFRVEYGDDVIAELKQVIEDCSPQNNKIIFAGHRGCGKSTLLAELTRHINHQYFIVFFSISDLIEMSDVNHINILFAIALQMMEKAEEQNVKIKTSTKDALYKWFATKTRTETENVSAEIAGGFNLWGFLKNQLKINASVRHDIKIEFERKISDLTGRVDEIASIIEAAINREILVIIDDLDKLDLGTVNDIFRNNIKSLFQPNIRIVFTVPVAVLREIPIRRTLETETNNQICQMSVAKLFKKDEIRQPQATPIDETISVLQKVLERRVPTKLIELGITRQIVLSSGGVLREIIRITQKCCSKCLLEIRKNPQNQDVKIDAKIVESAITDLRNDFATPLGKSQYDILTEIYKEFTPQFANEAEEQKFLDLLDGLYILEYRNADLWYDVHPIVADLLKRRGLI